MSNPSFSNIDLWLFELAEGNLSPEQVQRLELFLLQNPDLDIERDMWELARVENTSIVYPETASLERKRRPVAIYLASLLLLLIVGAGSFGIWTLSSGLEEEKELKANVQIKQEKLEQEVDYLKSELSRLMNKSTVKENLRIDDELIFSKYLFSKLFSNPVFETNSTKNYWNDDSRPVNSNESWFASSSNDFVTRNFIEYGDTVTNETINSIRIDSYQNSTPAQLLASYQTNLTPSENSVSSENRFDNNHFSSPSVGRENFHTRSVTQIDYTGKHRWVERSQQMNYGTSKVGDNLKLSFGKKLKRMSRMIRRMADNPIALRNSRDPHYHVPGLTSNDISFSSAGTLISTRVQAMSRIQWLGQENEQLISEVAIDGYAYGIRGGWGVQLNHSLYDDGGINIGQIAFTYSPKFSVNNWFSIEPSVRFKMGDKILDAQMLDGINQVELDRGNTQEFYPGADKPIGRNLWYRDMGVGLLVNTKWFFVGVQADNLFKHNDNIYSNDWSSPRRAGNHIIATIGTDWLSKTEKFGMSPYVVYQKKENLSEAWAGVNFKWNWLNLGIAASEKLDPSASIGMKLDQFSLHYNADYTTSTMTGERALSHQVTLRVQAKKSRYGQRLIKL